MLLYIDVIDLSRPKLSHHFEFTENFVSFENLDLMWSFCRFFLFFVARYRLTKNELATLADNAQRKFC